MHYEDILKLPAAEAAKTILNLNPSAIDKERIEAIFAAIIEAAVQSGCSRAYEVEEFLSRFDNELRIIAEMDGRAAAMMHPDYEIFRLHMTQIRRQHSDFVYH
jgi:hypothetical protein